MGRVVHFEITAEDMPRARKFYSIFGWNIGDSGMDGMEYLLARTGTSPMGIDGAIMPKNYNRQPAIIWISVDSLPEMMEQVKEAGGEILGEPQNVPGIGDTVYCKDTEGNVLGLIEALPRNG